jgi:TRAP-type mannitol/chloroaromatic compound transport system substrate-binding protein
MSFRSLFAGCLLAAGAGLTAGDAPLTWDVPTFYQAHMQGIGTTLPWLAREVERSTGGSLKLKVHEPGQLLKSPKEILEAVSNGEIQAGYGAATFWQGKMPAAPLFTAVPFGPDAPEYLAWMWYGNGMKLYQKMYDQAGFQVKVLVAGVSTPETCGWFKTEITSPEQFKGMKMRIAGLGGTVMQKLGAVTQQTPPAEIFQALEKGVLDATEFSTPAADTDLGFSKIAKYNYFPGWHQQATVFELLINRKAWEKLGPARQALLENLCRASVAESLAFSEAIQAKALKENADKGVQNRQLPENVLAALRTAWGEVVTEESNKNAFFKEVWTDLSAFRAEYATWASRGFLPRTKAE